MKKLLSVCIILAVAGLSAADLQTLNRKRDVLLSDERLKPVHAADPLLGEWLGYQKHILSNLEQAIKADPKQAQSMLQDYEFLLTRLEEEIEFAAQTPVIDESKFFNVKEFGARGDGAADDGDAIRKAIAAAAASSDGKRTVFLPRGRYLVRNTGSVTGNIKLENLENIRLVGERGSEILLPGALDVGVRIYQCNNVGLKNLTFTYQISPYMTGTITAFPAADVMRVKPDPGMIAPTDPIFQRAQTKGLMRFYTAALIPGSNRPFLSSIAPHQGDPAVTKAGDDMYDFKVKNFIPVTDHYTVGTKVAFYARTYGNHTINNADSARTRLENLTINTSSAMAILNNGSERPFVINCRVEALPGSFVSTSADGIYMRNISLGGYVKGNIVRHVGDDFMNIHTIVHPADKAGGKTISLKAAEWNPRYLVPGCRLGLIRTSIGQSGVTEERKIVEVTEKDGFHVVTLDTPFTTIALRDTAEKLPDMLMLLENQSHGLVVTGNRFEDGLSRFLAGGRNWLFVNNTVIDSLSHSFFMNLCPEAVGRDGGEFVSPRNIEFSGNRFETAAKTLFRSGGSANRFIPADTSIPSTTHIRFLQNNIQAYGKSKHPLYDLKEVEFLSIE